MSGAMQIILSLCNAVVSARLPCNTSVHVILATVHPCALCVHMRERVCAGVCMCRNERD